VYVLNVPLTGSFFTCLPHLKTSYSLKQDNIEIRPIKNPTMYSMCSSERKIVSPTLSKKLQIIKLSREGILKAEKG
jgi:hypothetical protein